MMSEPQVSAGHMTYRSPDYMRWAYTSPQTMVWEMNGDKSNCVLGDPNNSLREYTWAMRRILLRQYMDPEKTYYIRMKSVLDTDAKEFYMDYIELCPKEVFDNPETPEDIW